MARDPFQTLTEQMFYVLLALCEIRNGAGIRDYVQDITGGRVKLAPGTLYALLAQFLDYDLIERVNTEQAGKNYIITNAGRQLLHEEKIRLESQIQDFQRFYH